MPANKTLLPIPYFGDVTRGRPLAGGFVYIGGADLDPETFQSNVYYVEENGDEVLAEQPLNIGTGGYIEYNGKPVSIATGTPYSIRTRNKQGAENFYAPNVNNTDYTGGSGVSVENKVNRTGDVMTGVLGVVDGVPSNSAMTRNAIFIAIDDALGDISDGSEDYGRLTSPITESVDYGRLVNE